MTIDERTQQILAERIGMSLIASARLQAENEALRAAAAVQAGGGGTGAARVAEQPTGQDTI